jgi:carboxyl-terminal processing protease
MISKTRAFFTVLIAVIITIVLTTAANNYFAIKNYDKVIITDDKYIEYETMQDKYNKVEYIEGFVEENFLYDIEEGELYEGALKGMLDILDDPYSEYMTEGEFNDLIEQTSGEYSGIGVYVSVTEDNRIIIVSPIEDTPADQAGLKTGDYISKVNGIEYAGDDLSDAVDVMKGKSGTDVDITISREDDDGVEADFDVTITRDNIKIKTIKYDMVDDDIGYIRITTFDQQTDADFKDALDDLESQGMTGLVVDLRYNPGGLISSVSEIADELLGETIITYTQTKYGEREYYYSDKDKIDVPLAVLINEGSASASEILSGAVKDTESGVLIGTKTFGKGIVQRIIPLADGAGLKLTVSEYFTPNDINIHGVGIEPDVYLEMDDDIIFGPDNIDEDIQLQRAVEIINMR